MAEKTVPQLRDGLPVTDFQIEPFRQHPCRRRKCAQSPLDELRMVASWKCSDCYDCNQCVKAAIAIETLLAERDAAMDSLHRIKTQLEGSAELAVAGFQKVEEVWGSD